MCTMWMHPKLVPTCGWYLSILPHIQNFHLKKLQSKVCVSCLHLAALPNLNWFTGSMAFISVVPFYIPELLIYIPLQHTVSSLQWKGGLRSSVFLTLSSVVRSDLITSLVDKINIEFTELRVMTWAKSLCSPGEECYIVQNNVELWFQKSYTFVSNHQKQKHFAVSSQ